MHFAKESIFKAALRSCLKSFGVVIGLFLGFWVIMMGVMVLTASSEYLPSKSEVTLMPDAEGNREMLPENDPAILRIDIAGVIGVGELTGEAIKNLLLDSRESPFGNNRLKGILLYIDTPGGTATDSDNIYRVLLAYKQKYQIPIYAYVDGMCASGGMYIASAADKVYASPSSVIGSVGVVLGPTFNFSQLMEKVGVQSLTLTEGKDKDFLNPFRPWKSDEAAPVKPIVASLYHQFVDIVTAARPRLDKQKLIEVYGAHIFISGTAAELGYIDVADSNYDTALIDLKNQAGIGEKQPYQVIKLSRSRPFLSELTGSGMSLLKGQITHTISLSPEYSPELSGKFLYLYSPTLNVQ
jgi:protease-4